MYVGQRGGGGGSKNWENIDSFSSLSAPEIACQKMAGQEVVTMHGTLKNMAVLNTFSIYTFLDLFVPPLVNNFIFCLSSLNMNFFF